MWLPCPLDVPILEKTEISRDSQRVGVPRRVERVSDTQNGRRGMNTQLTSLGPPNAGHR